MYKKCKTCGEERPLTEFSLCYISRAISRRAVNKRGTEVRASRCKACMVRYNDNYTETPQGYYVAKKAYALRMKKEFTLTLFDIETLLINNNCFYCNMTADEAFILIEKLSYYLRFFKYLLQKRKLNKRLIIERYDNTKGYIKTNVVMACVICNTLKHFTHGDEYQKIAKANIERLKKIVL